MSSFCVFSTRNVQISQILLFQFQQLDQQSGSGDIVIRREMFNQYYDRLKVTFVAN
jgi:hypothetical protein